MKVFVFVRHKMMCLFARMIRNDDLYCRVMYFFKCHKFLSLKNIQEKGYNAKLQWLKLRERHEEYSLLVDKFKSKQYVAEKFGKRYIIPTLGIFDRFEDINFSSLPSKYVIKCTHDSGGVVICTDKSKFNYSTARKKINNCLKSNFYLIAREYPYKNVVPRILVERYICDSSGNLKDYKFFCFNGVVKMILIVSDRGHGTYMDFFDRNFCHLPFERGHKNSPASIQKPPRFEEMVKLAEKFSAGIKHVRVDLYNVDGEIYFGEYTFFPAGGFTPFKPELWDLTVGSWLKV